MLCSGTIGDHGTAVMLARGDLALEADIVSDTAPLHGLVEPLLGRGPVHPVAARRHPGRGRHGLQRAGPGQRPHRRARRGGPARAPGGGAACELLGIDPLYVANEGKFVAVVAPEEADEPWPPCVPIHSGRDAAAIGEIRADPPGIVVLVTGFGGTRIVDMLVGDPLPRIC